MAEAGHITMTPKYDSGNYAHWSMLMERILRGHGLWIYVQGKVTAPAEDYTDSTTTKAWLDWDKLDSKAVAIILQGLDQEKLNLVSDCKTSQQTWDRLKELAQPKATDVLMTAMTEFLNTQWESTDSVTSFLSRLAQVIGRIQSSQTKVTIMDSKSQDRWVIAKILSSLPSRFASFVQSWNMMAKDDAKLDDFRQKLLAAERGLTGQAESSEATAGDAFAAHSKTKDKSKAKNKKYDGECHYCHKKGHKQAECRKKQRDEGAKTPAPSKTEPTMAAYGASTEPNDLIIADSGASRHITRRLDWFVSVRKLAQPSDFGCANGQAMFATHVGDIRVEVSVNGKNWSPIRWTDVLYVPNAGHATLFSTAYMNTKGYAFSHENNRMRLTKDGKPVLGGNWNGIQFIPFIRVLKPTGSAMAAQPIDLWHQRLGHINDDVLRAMDKKGLVEGLNLTNSERSLCDACHYGKQTACSHPARAEPRDCKPGERFHSDVGHMNEPSWAGHRYWITFKDESSGFRYVAFMRSKTEVPKTVKKFLDWAEQKTGRKPVSFRTDNGTEYVNKDLESILDDKGMTHERSPPHTKQANGMAERENRTLCDTMRTLLYNADLSKAEHGLLWVEAMSSAAYLRNRVPNRNRTDTTPYELWYGKKPNVGHLRVFGSPAFVKVPESQRRKLDCKARKTVFVGYDSQTDKHVRVYDRDRRAVDIVSDVTVEDTRPVPGLSWTRMDTTNDPEPEQADHESEPDASDHESQASEPEPETAVKKRGRPVGSKNKPKEPALPHGMTTRSKAVSQLAMVAAADPATVKEALARPDGHLWQEAMNEEYQALVDNDTWSLEQLPDGRNLVTSKWVLRSKINPDGTLNKRKARLVARGFSQSPGIDYFETYSPVVRYESVRCFLAIAAHLDMELIQFDVKTAFLNGPLQETVYIEQPEGFRDGTDRVCKLKKSLYGLKQAPLNWFKTMQDFLTSYGFTASEQDGCIFVKRLDKGHMLLSLYVDDGLVGSTNPNDLRTFMDKLRKRFKITENEPSYYVGMELKRDRETRTVRVSQRGYLTRVLQRFGLSEASPISCPIDPTLKLAKASETEDEHDCPYREAVGSLNYAAVISRPDIAHSVNLLARFCNKPTKTHWSMVKRVMRYLKATLDYALVLGPGAAHLHGYSDSDWGGDMDERKSTSGFVFMLLGGPVAWSSGLQELSALSVAEAEVIALAEAVKQCLWLRPLITELGLPVDKPTLISCDNQVAIALAKNPEFHKRSKHFGIRYHRLKQEQDLGTMVVDYVPTKDNPADMFTKSLSAEPLRHQLGLMNLECVQ